MDTAADAETPGGGDAEVYTAYDHTGQDGDDGAGTCQYSRRSHSGADKARRDAAGDKHREPALPEFTRSTDGGERLGDKQAPGNTRLGRKGYEKESSIQVCVETGTSAGS